MTTLAISIGCPCGIGPEVSVAAAAKEKAARIVLVGDHRVLLRAAKIVGVDPKRLVRIDDPLADVRARQIAVWQPTADLAWADARPGKPTKAAGAAQLAWIDAATDLVARGDADALVTAPVSKDVIASSGAKGSKAFLGHTEHLARRLRAPEVTMAFYTEKLTTSLVTTHLPLTAVPRAITAKEVARAVYWTARFVEALGDERAVGVASLNPHAGENGRLGKDESRAITPGIALARKRTRAKIEGPIPAESAFRLAANGKYAAVVAMYHDQATIPMKLLGFGEAVNVSLGLPIIRTSVDHGTAYDRAGKGTADPRGMREAIALAIRLAS
jgi:4-hydroxythreonine-4-phosphate dehydrogenase